MKDTGQLKRLFLDEAPMIDVRAEVEFAQGAFPGAVNIPILNDNERHLVGPMRQRSSAMNWSPVI